MLGGLAERDRFLPWRDKLEREGLDIVLPGKVGDVLVEGCLRNPRRFGRNAPSSGILGSGTGCLSTRFGRGPIEIPPSTSVS